MSSRRVSLVSCCALAIAVLPFAANSQTMPTVPSLTNGSPPTVSVSLPRHIVIPILIDKDIRVGGTGDEKQTKSIKLVVAQDVILNGWLIAETGDLAEGHLTTSKNITKRYFSTDVSQEAALDIDDIVNFCGDTIHMQFERTFVGGVRGGFLSLGSHAHDAVFAKGLVLKAESDRLEKSVCALRSDRAAQPLPADIVVPDDEVETK